MIGRVVVLAVALVSGATTSQLPEFSQQYRQRLGGAIDALGEVVDGFQADAARFGLTGEQVVERLQTADDALTRSQGDRMQATMARLGRLKAQRTAFEGAGPLLRMVVMLSDLDPQIARATADDFEPAVPVTGEGALSALAGALLGLLGAGAIGRAGRRLRRRRRVDHHA